MSSAPERISIKRRRDDEVVDVLALASSKKQRTSDHYFVRLGHEYAATTPTRTLTAPATSTSATKTYKPPPGVPLIGTTRPGDEIRDFQRYKAAQDIRNGICEDRAKISAALSSGQTDGLTRPPPDARRFHLTRDLSLGVRPQQAGSTQPLKSSLRPHIPTFIEKIRDTNIEELASYAEPPIDRIIRSVDGANHDLDVKRILSEDGSVKREKTATFQKLKPSVAKTGQSIRDDPATWDLNSDRLADELMTLALEMDPDAKAAFDAEPRSYKNADMLDIQPDPMIVDGVENYVFETYVRVQENSIPGFDLTQSSNLGYLVIDEEQEELWEQYLNDDDDDDEDWDEEDADSNAEDNPRNDYPEDEVSSDDEFDRDIYQYRRDYSDDGRIYQDYQ